MHAHQQRLQAGNIALHQRDMLGIIQRVDIHRHAPVAAMMADKIRIDRALNEMIVAAAMGDEIGDGADL